MTNFQTLDASLAIARKAAIDEVAANERVETLIERLTRATGDQHKVLSRELREAQRQKWSVHHIRQDAYQDVQLASARLNQLGQLQAQVASGHVSTPRHPQTDRSRTSHRTLFDPYKDEQVGKASTPVSTTFPKTIVEPPHLNYGAYTAASRPGYVDNKLPSRETGKLWSHR